MSGAELIAVIITAAEVSKTLSRIGFAFRRAPEELLTLVNEVEDFRVILQELSNITIIIHSHQSNPTHEDFATERLSPLLDSARDSLQALERIVIETISGEGEATPPALQSVVSRVKWMKNRKRVGVLTKHLRTLRMDLIAALGLIQSSTLFNTAQSQLQTINAQNLALESSSQLTNIESVIRQINKIRGTEKIEDIEQILASKEILSQVQSSRLSEIQTDSYSISYFRGHREHCSLECACCCHHKRFYATPSLLQSTVGQITAELQRLPRKACDQIHCTSNTAFGVSIRYTFPSWFMMRGIFLALRHNRKVGPICVLRIHRVMNQDSETFRLCYDGNLDRLKELFATGQARPSDIDSNFDTLLHKATRENQVKICEFLLQNGSDVYDINNRNKSAADLAWDRIISDIADPAMKRLFINSEDVLLERQFSKLHFSVLGLINQGLEQILEDSSVEVNVVDCNSRSALYWAVRRADITSAKLLLHFGADPNVGVSAIAWSCKDSFVTPECLQALLDAGANANGWDSYCHTALQACGIFGKDASFIKPLVAAGAQVDTVYGGDVVSLHGVTALGFACLNAHPTTVGVLLSQGADIDWQDSRGRTPLHLALSQSWDRITEERILETVGVLLNFHPEKNVRDQRGFSPGNLAILNQKIDSLAVLMDSGSNIVYPPNLGPSQNGYCMLAWPIENRWYSVSTFLLGRRDVNVFDTHPETNDTILHLLAKYSDQRFLVTFEETVDLSRLHAQAVNSSGLTPLDCFATRNRPSQTLERSFNDLLRRIEEASSKDTVLDEIHFQEEAFWDVLEYPTTMTDAAIPISVEELSVVESEPTVKSNGSSDDFDGSSWQDAMRRDFSLLGQPNRKDEDSEQELTLMAWQNRHTRRRARRVNCAFDSGYASAESGHTTEDEGEFTSPSLRSHFAQVRYLALRTNLEFLVPLTYAKWQKVSVFSRLLGHGTIEIILGNIKILLLVFGVFLFLALTGLEGSPSNVSSQKEWVESPRNAHNYKKLEEYPLNVHTSKEWEISHWDWEESVREVQLKEWQASLWRVRTPSVDHKPQAEEPSCQPRRTPYRSKYPRLLYPIAVAVFSTFFLTAILPPPFPILSSFKKFCVRQTRPRVPKNHRRITWICDCGKEIYGDFSTTNPSDLADLNDALSQTSSRNAQEETTPTVPAQVYLASQRSNPGGSASQSSPSKSDNAGVSQVLPSPSNGPLVPKFFELCVNTGEFSKTLGEIDVTRVTNDINLFQLISRKYCDIRAHRIKKHYLLKPIAMQFVHFCVEDRHRVSILAKDSYPLEPDVSAKQYHYNPCPPKPPPPMPSDAFMHLMKCARTTNNSPCKTIWFHRLPKKLYTSITRSRETLPEAWGVHIVEGPDTVNIIWTLICVLIVCLGPVVAYVVKTKDVSGATGIGGVLVTVLTLLWMAMKIQQWKDE